MVKNYRRDYRLKLVLGPVLSVAAGCMTTTDPGDPCAPPTTSRAGTVSYADDIVPLFTAAGCLTSACHGGEFPSSNFSLDSYESSFVAGDEANQLNVCVISRGNPDESFLIEKLRSENPRLGLQMPLEREVLTEEEIALIETWIEEGAQDN